MDPLSMSLARTSGQGISGQIPKGHDPIDKLTEKIKRYLDCSGRFKKHAVELFFYKRKIIKNFKQISNAIGDKKNELIIAVFKKLNTSSSLIDFCGVIKNDVNKKEILISLNRLISNHKIKLIKEQFKDVSQETEVSSNNQNAEINLSSETEVVDYFKQNIKDILNSNIENKDELKRKIKDVLKQIGNRSYFFEVLLERANLFLQIVDDFVRNSGIITNFEIDGLININSDILSKFQRMIQLAIEAENIFLFLEISRELEFFQYEESPPMSESDFNAIVSTSNSCINDYSSHIVIHLPISEKKEEINLLKGLLKELNKDLLDRFKEQLQQIQAQQRAERLQQIQAQQRAERLQQFQNSINELQEQRLLNPKQKKILEGLSCAGVFDEKQLQQIQNESENPLQQIGNESASNLEGFKGSVNNFLGEGIDQNIQNDFYQILWDSYQIGDKTRWGLIKLIQSSTECPELRGLTIFNCTKLTYIQKITIIGFLLKNSSNLDFQEYFQDDHLSDFNTAIRRAKIIILLKTNQSSFNSFFNEDTLKGFYEKIWNSYLCNNNTREAFIRSQDQQNREPEQLGKALIQEYQNRESAYFHLRQRGIDRRPLRKEDFLEALDAGIEYLITANGSLSQLSLAAQQQ